MAIRKKEIVEEKDFDITKYDQHLKNQNICEMIQTNYMPYAMSVIISRALPDVRDGLKPSQRKVLYTMKNMNLVPGHKSKSANIAGTTLRLNPHSDQSCYETMVRLTDSNETLLSPYVSGKGSFGKHYSRDMSFAASRYCVTGDTLIPTINGTIKIKDIVTNSKIGETYDINLKIKSAKGQINNASKFFNSGKHDVYKITLENGMELKATPNHPILVIYDDKSIDWKLMQDLKVGDRCIIDTDISNALFGNNNNLNEIDLIIEKLLNNQYKNFPESIFKGTKKYQKTFLITLLNKKNKYESKNLEIVKSLQILLLNFGIISYIKNENDKYLLEISCDDFNLLINKEDNKDSYSYSSISNKEYIGKEVVYSIKVDSNCHSFSGNGFINHNTEASLSPLGMELFKGINKNAIDMIDNYDGTMKEPSILPVSFPAVLANPTLGIAVGFASNICSFNLKELCEATIEKIRHPKSDLLDVMPGPDFCSGGSILYNKNEMLDIYATGKGAIKIRSKYEINNKKNRIEIKEIPYSTTAEAIVESIINLCKTGKIKEINDVRDDTDKKGLTITIEYKRSCDPEQLMLKLFKMTPLEDTFNCNFNVILDGNPKCLGVYQILDEWIKFRKNCTVRMLIFEKTDAENKLHLLRGLEKILVNIDKCIKIIKNTEKDIDVVPNLMKAFKIDELQATYIADMKLRYINKQYILSKTTEIEGLESQIIGLNKKINSDTEIKKLIITDLQSIIKRFSVERKTKIIDASSVEVLNDEPDVQQYDVSIYITEHGYIKKTLSSLINETTEIKIKDGDTIKYTFKDNNLSDLLIFTNKANVYKLKVSDIMELKPSDFGNYLYSLLDIEESENIIFTTCTKDYNDNLLLAFENGKVALIPLKAYETKTNRKMLKNAFFDKSKVIFMDVVGEDLKYYILGNNKNKKLIFTNKNIPLKSTKTTQGIQIFRLTNETFITDCNPIKITNKKTIEKYLPNNYPASGR